MTYRVLWSPQAEERLESLLKEAYDPPALIEAGREVDRHLLGDPNAFGESRYDTVRVGFTHPLGILFEVMDDVRTVIVFEVWRTDRK